MATAARYTGAMTPEHLKPPAVRSALEVALWYQARAAEAGGSLSARKLQCLLYLSQALYAAAQSGRKLMPATFVAGPDGPTEPTLAQVEFHPLHVERFRRAGARRQVYAKKLAMPGHGIGLPVQKYRFH